LGRDLGGGELTHSISLRGLSFFLALEERSTPAEPAQACLLGSATASLHGYGKGNATERVHGHGPVTGTRGRRVESGKLKAESGKRYGGAGPGDSFRRREQGYDCLLLLHLAGRQRGKTTASCTGRTGAPLSESSVFAPCGSHRNLGPHSVSRSMSRTCRLLPYRCGTVSCAAREERRTAFPSHSSQRSSKLWSAPLAR
jgi:hypothetical protein